MFADLGKYLIPDSLRLLLDCFSNLIKDCLFEDIQLFSEILNLFKILIYVFCQLGLLLSEIYNWKVVFLFLQNFICVNFVGFKGKI